MRIVQLGPVPPPHGGVSMNMLAIHGKLIELGHESKIIDVTDRGGKTTDTHVLKPRSALGLIKLLVSMECDIVHYHLGGDFSAKLAGLVYLCGVLPGKRSVLTFHSGGYARNSVDSARRRSIRGSALRSIDLVIGVNDEMMAMFKAFGVNKERACLILPFELNKPDPSVRLPDELEERSTRFDPFLVSVGALEREYGNQFLVDAMPKLLERFPHAGLMIVGAGEQQDTLSDAIKARGLAERIVMTGDLDHRFVLHLIARADVLMRLTDYDGDSIAVREALFLGTPVIASDNVMRPDGVFLLKPPFDPGRLLQAVIGAYEKQNSGPSAASVETGNAARVVAAYQELMQK